MQALQRDASEGLSVSTGQVSTRKRKGADSSSDAAAAAAAAAAAPDALNSAVLASDQSVDASPATDAAGRSASESTSAHQASVKGRRRMSQRTASKPDTSGADKQPAAEGRSSITRTSEDMPKEGRAAEPDAAATAVASGGHSSVTEQEGQGQAGSMPAPALPQTAKTRSRRGISPMPVVKTEETAAADAHTQDRQADGERSNGGGAESERDRRVSARQLRTAASSKPKPAKGQCMSLSAWADGPISHVSCMSDAAVHLAETAVYC